MFASYYYLLASLLTFGAAVVLLVFSVRYRQRASLPATVPAGLLILTFGKLWWLAVQIFGAEDIQWLLARISELTDPGSDQSRDLTMTRYGAEVGPLFRHLSEMSQRLEPIGLLLLATGLFVHTSRLIRARIDASYVRTSSPS